MSAGIDRDYIKPKAVYKDRILQSKFHEHDLLVSAAGSRASIVHAILKTLAVQIIGVSLTL